MLNLDQDVAFRTLVRNEIIAYTDRLITTLQEVTIDKLIDRNLYILQVSDPNVTAGDLLRKVLHESIQPTKEVLFAPVLERVLHYAANKHRGGTVVLTSGRGEGIDLEGAGHTGFRAFIADLKSGLTWGNSKSKAKLRDILYALASKRRGPIDLIEAVFCGNKKERRPHSNGVQTIQRLAGAELFEYMAGDRRLGWNFMQVLHDITQEYAQEREFGSLDRLIDHEIGKSVERLLNTYRTGYKGKVLWSGNVVRWDNLLRLNSGEFEVAQPSLDLPAFKQAA